jgi:hypothetical protein
MSRKLIYTIGIGIGLMAVLIVGFVVLLHLRGTSQPDPNTATVQEKAEYLASDEFGKLETEEKRTYLDKLRSQAESQEQPRPMVMTDLTDEQRDQMIKNMMPVISQWVNERWAEYEQLTPVEQTARLDQFIDRIEEERKRNPQAHQERIRRFTPKRLNMLLEHTDPKTRSQFARFRTALEERMRERGVPIDW